MHRNKRIKLFHNNNVSIKSRNCLRLETDNRISNGTSEDEGERVRLRKEVSELRKGKQNADERVLK